MNGEVVTSSSWDGVEGGSISWVDASHTDDSPFGGYPLTGHTLQPMFVVGTHMTHQTCREKLFSIGCWLGQIPHA